MSEVIRFVRPEAALSTVVLREDGRLYIRTTQDTRPILEGNLRARGFYEPEHVRKNPGHVRWVSRLPWVTVLALNKRGIMRGCSVIDQKAFFKFIDDSEHRAFRTDNGRRLRNLPSRGHL